MSIWLTDLADVCRAAGLEVVEVPGWRTRGYLDQPMQDVRGVIAHHTETPASEEGDMPTLGMLLEGRSDLPGPLSQLGLSRSGVVHVVAAGLCNHAGPSDRPEYANKHAIGIEAEHPGVGPWPQVQYDAYVRLCRALMDHYGTPPPRGHKETAVPYGRKVDPNFDMDRFRADVCGEGRPR